MKSVLFVVIGLILLSGCGNQNDKNKASQQDPIEKSAKIDSLQKLAERLDSLYKSAKNPYVKIESLSTPDVTVYAINNDTSYFEGKAKLVNYGVEFSNEVANVIGRKSFVNVDGITVEQLKTVLTEIDSLRKLNKPNN